MTIISETHKEEFKKCKTCKKTKSILKFSKIIKKKVYYKNDCFSCEESKRTKYDIDLTIKEFKCIRCKEVKNINAFSKDARRKTGKAHHCSSCHYKDTKKYAPDLSIENKKCNTCEEVKHIDNFNRHKSEKGGYNRTCKQCKWKRDKNREQSDPENYKRRRRERHLERSMNPKSKASQLLLGVRHRAKKRNLAFDLDIEWLSKKIEFGRCEVTGIKFDLSPFSQSPTHGANNQIINAWSPTLDRIEPNKGYVKENVRLVVKMFNTFKNFWDDDTVLTWALAFTGNKVRIPFNIFENSKSTGIHELNHKAYLLLNRMNQQRRERGIKVEIDKKWILNELIKGKCSVTGIPFDMRKGTKKPRYIFPFSPSPDRINPELGYTKKNTRLVCYIHNWGRQNTDDKHVEELAKMVGWGLLYGNGRIKI